MQTPARHGLLRKTPTLKVIGGGCDDSRTAPSGCMQGENCPEWAQGWEEKFYAESAIYDFQTLNQINLVSGDIGCGTLQTSGQAEGQYILNRHHAKGLFTNTWSLTHIHQNDPGGLTHTRAVWGDGDFIYTCVNFGSSSENGLYSYSVNSQEK